MDTGDLLVRYAITSASAYTDLLSIILTPYRDRMCTSVLCTDRGAGASLSVEVQYTGYSLSIIREYSMITGNNTGNSISRSAVSIVCSHVLYQLLLIIAMMFSSAHDPAILGTVVA